MKNLVTNTLFIKNSALSRGESIKSIVIILNILESKGSIRYLEIQYFKSIEKNFYKKYNLKKISSNKSIVKNHANKMKNTVKICLKNLMIPTVQNL